MNITYCKIEAGFYTARVDGIDVPALAYKAGGVWVVRVTSVDVDDNIPYYFLTPAKTLREAKVAIAEWLESVYFPMIDAAWDEAHKPVDTTIQFGKGWNCCKAKPAKVVVFDNGARCTCQHCASMYTGEIQELPETESATVSVTDFLILRRLATLKGYKLRNNPLAVYKDGFLAMDFTSVENCRTWLNGHDDAYTLSDLLTESATVNLAIAHKAKALMLTMGEQHPSFDVAVQVHKDALHAYQEARRTTAFL